MKADSLVQSVNLDTRVIHQQISAPSTAPTATAASSGQPAITTPAATPQATTADSTASPAAASPATAATPAVTANASSSTAAAAAPEPADTSSTMPSAGTEANASTAANASSAAANGTVKPISILQVQQNAPYDLDILDQAGLPLDGKYEYTNDGTGVNVYMLDTGIRKTHEEFRYAPYMNKTGTRALHAWSAVGDPSNSDDCLGHGTHTAGSVGGLTYGVAKNATLWAVRVINCDGSAQSSAVIAGLDWLAQNYQLPAVASMSLGSDSPNQALDDAVTAIIALGITAVIAAGNYNQDACQLSPARLPAGITVAASDKTDTRWPNSNYGRCVDLYGPGVAVLSAMDTSDTATMTASGTSMACPHVSGVAALYLQSNPTAQPNEVSSTIIETAAEGQIKNADENVGTPNRKLQTYLNTAPSVTITPAVLPPVVLFAGASFSAAAASTQTIVLANAGNSSVTFNASATPTGLFGGWISMAPSTGTIAAGQSMNLVLTYDITQNTFQTVLQAAVLITTSGRPAAKSMTASAYVFCPALQTALPEATHTTSIAFPLVQDTRPITADWPALANTNGTWVYFDAQIQFSHPVGSLAESALEINEGAGRIEAINSTGPNGDLCGGFTIRAKVQFSPWETLQTTVGVTVKGAEVTDVYGKTFPTYVNTSTIDHRPVGQFFAPYMPYSGSQGLVTSEQNVVLLLVWSEPVTGLTPNSFSVSGPSVTASIVSGLKLLRGTNTYYHLTVNLPGDYYGGVTVTLQGTVTDTAGTSYATIKSPGLLTLT
ncbi:hypothetical protein ABBQ32_009426 [Trebouxia sp. C0010 RCD-2024]